MVLMALLLLIGAFALPVLLMVALRAWGRETVIESSLLSPEATAWSAYVVPEGEDPTFSRAALGHAGFVSVLDHSGARRLVVRCEPDQREHVRGPWSTSTPGLNTCSSTTNRCRRTPEPNGRRVASPRAGTCWPALHRCARSWCEPALVRWSSGWGPSAALVGTWCSTSARGPDHPGSTRCSDPPTPAEKVNIMRATFDKLISWAGLLLAAVLLVAGGLLTWASTVRREPGPRPARRPAHHDADDPDRSRRAPCRPTGPLSRSTPASS